MKTLLSLKSFPLYGIVAFLVFSCSKDEEIKDVRDQAVGTYNYTAKFYEIAAGSNTLEYWGSDYDESGTFIVNKTDQGFEVKEGGEVQFRGSKVAAATNGFSFDIETQTISDNGGTITIEGYDGVALGSVKYHGGFFKPNLLEAWFQTDVVLQDANGNQYEALLVIQYSAAKL